MVMPGDRYPRADDVLVDVGLRAQVFVRDEVADATLGTTRNLAKNSSKDGRPTLLRADLRR
jgi:hypothetical protein